MLYDGGFATLYADYFEATMQYNAYLTELQEITNRFNALQSVYICFIYK
jgi:hypothetical protein